jgi:hypothetical protein
VLLGENHETVWAENESLAIAYEKNSKLNLSLTYWKKSLAYKEQKYGEYDLDTNETRETVGQLEKRVIEQNLLKKTK